MANKISSETKVEKILATWGVIVVLWSLFRANFQPPLWFSEFVAKPLIFILPIYVCLKKYEGNENFLYQIGLLGGNLVKNLVFAMFAVGLIITVGLVSLTFFPNVSFTLTESFDYIAFSNLLGMAAVTSFSEEILGRGFLFAYLYKYSKSFVVSLLISSMLFFVLYIPGALTIGLSGGELFMNLLLSLTLSFVTGTVYFLRGNLLASIGVHAGILMWFELFLK